MTLEEVRTFLNRKFKDFSEEDNYFRSNEIEIVVTLTNGKECRMVVNRAIIETCISRMSGTSDPLLPTKYYGVRFLIDGTIAFMSNIDNIEKMTYAYELCEETPKETEINFNEVKKDVDKELSKESSIEQKLDKFYKELIKPFIVKVAKDIYKEIKNDTKN